jgi:hypothetical protein
MTTAMIAADASLGPDRSRRKLLVRLALIVGVLVLLGLVVFAGVSIFAADPMAGT